MGFFEALAKTGEDDIEDSSPEDSSPDDEISET